MTNPEKMRVGLAKEQLAPGAVVLTGLDDALVGHSSNGQLVYSERRMIRLFQKQGMSLEGANDWIEANVLPLALEQSGYVYLYEL